MNLDIYLDLNIHTLACGMVTIQLLMDVMLQKGVAPIQVFQETEVRSCLIVI